jgi:segregation and condensation protein B
MTSDDELPKTDEPAQPASEPAQPASEPASESDSTAAADPALAADPAPEVSADAEVAVAPANAQDHDDDAPTLHLERIIPDAPHGSDVLHHASDALDQASDALDQASDVLDHGSDEPHDIPPDPGSADAASPRLQSIVESLLFASDKPLSLKQLGELLGESELARVRAAVAAVEQSYQTRGFQLHQVAGGYQFRTNPENANWVQKLLAQKPVKLSRALLETLAIVAYRQPITRPEIDEIRGVDSGGTLKTLMERSLARILGKKEEPGRPMLYGTTREFLEFFNLGDLKDLPTLREFHELSDEHKAQVEALEGVAPAGSIEGPEGQGAADAPLPLTRLEVTTPPEDEHELEEIDRLIRTAGAKLVTDEDQPHDGHDEEHAPTGEFESLPTREIDHLSDEPTLLHVKKVSAKPEGDRDDDVDGEFDPSQATNPRVRLDLEDPFDADDGQSDETDESET